MRMTGRKLFRQLAQTTCTSIATWNVHILVESAGGDRQICRSRPRLGPSYHEVDQKFDFAVKELKRLRVAIAWIQETKWFGKDVWNANSYTLLHSGHLLPNEGEPQMRNEGVGVLLDKHATDAWKDAGENWKAVSSRVVMARLKVVRSGQRQPGRS